MNRRSSTKSKFLMNPFTVIILYFYFYLSNFIFFSAAYLCVWSKCEYSKCFYRNRIHIWNNYYYLYIYLTSLFLVNSFHVRYIIDTLTIYLFSYVKLILCDHLIFIAQNRFWHILLHTCENQMWQECENISLFKYDSIISGVDAVASVVESCGPSEATCSNKQCIPKSKVCDGEVDCSDGSDETRCSTFENSLAILDYKKLTRVVDKNWY